MDYPIKFEYVLPHNLFNSIQDDLCFDWTLNNYSSSPDQHLSWALSTINDKILFYEAAAIIKLKILKHLKQKMQLIKIHVNGQTFGQVAEFHYDFLEQNSWTFILFTNTFWNTQWGGEFVCQDPDTGKYNYTTYIPNCGVLIPAWWQHYGSSPNHSTDKLRTTIAFSYANYNEIENTLKYEKLVQRYI